MVLFSKLLAGALSSLAKIIFDRVALPVSFFRNSSNLTRGFWSLFVDVYNYYVKPFVQPVKIFLGVYF